MLAMFKIRWRMKALKALQCAVVSIVLCCVGAAFAGLGFLYLGIYDVAATKQHGPIISWVLHATALQSIHERAKHIKVPNLENPNLAPLGLELFRQHCVQCHGAPGEPPGEFAEGITPGAPRLVQVGREWHARDIYWTVAHGIKMTAMPAWDYRMSNRDIWAIVAFLKTRLPQLSPQAYRALVAKSALSGKSRAASPEERRKKAVEMERASVERLDAKIFEPGNEQRGKIALGQYACASCHNIPGISGPNADVGPPLTGIGSRTTIAGILVNTPDNMRRWIQHPQEIKPGDEMPDLGVGAQDARDMVAYLESLQ